MPLKVYFDLMSQPARAVLLYLKLNKIPYVECPVALRKAEHMTPEYEKINPFKLVPVIDHDGFKLTESAAILQYLSEQFKVADHWYPKDFQTRAKVNEYMHWHHLNTRISAARYFRSKLLDPIIFNKPVDQAKVEEYAKDIQKMLGHLENYFLKDNKFLCGQEITFADLQCACELEQPRCVGYDIIAGHKRVETWWDLVRSSTQPYYDETHKFIFKLKEQTSKL